MTAAWSVILMLMGWLPGNGARQPAINAPDLLRMAPPAHISVDNRLEKDQRQVLALERSA
jgi:hypothetical protein